MTASEVNMSASWHELRRREGHSNNPPSPLTHSPEADSRSRHPNRTRTRTRSITALFRNQAWLRGIQVAGPDTEAVSVRPHWYGLSHIVYTCLPLSKVGKSRADLHFSKRILQSFILTVRHLDTGPATCSNSPDHLRNWQSRDPFQPPTGTQRTYLSLPVSPQI